MSEALLFLDAEREPFRDPEPERDLDRDFLGESLFRDPECDRERLRERERERDARDAGEAEPLREPDTERDLDRDFLEPT